MKTGFLMAGLVALGLASGAVDAQQSGRHLDPQCLVSAWAPSSQDLAKSGRWRQKNDYDRLDLATQVPDLDGDAIRVFAKGGVVGNLLNYQEKLKQTPVDKPQAARIEVELYIPPDEGFNRSNAKLPLGIWGGEDGAKFCGSGLCPPRDQTGFTVRLTRTLLDPDDWKPPFPHGPRIYSYHLNRPGEAKVKQPINGQTEAKLRLQGDGIDLNVQMVPGNWYRVVLDVALNTFDGAAANADGFTNLYLYDDAGQLLGQTGKSGLIFRKSEDWFIFGPILTDLWGGKIDHKRNIPLADTSTFYEDYEMFLIAPDRALQDCVIVD